jgi:hypothetical protein
MAEKAEKGEHLNLSKNLACLGREECSPISAFSALSALSASRSLA